MQTTQLPPTASNLPKTTSFKREKKKQMLKLGKKKSASKQTSTHSTTGLFSGD
jgi:hypothetical protein